MSIFSLFNIPLGDEPSKSEDADQPRFGPEPSGAVRTTRTSGAKTSVGAFITPQTLVSFSGATGVISALFSFVKAMLPLPAPVGVYVLAILSAVVGTLIFWINTGDPKAAAIDAKARAVAIVIAAINTIILFNATRSILGV